MATCRVSANPNALFPASIVPPLDAWALERGSVEDVAGWKGRQLGRHHSSVGPAGGRMLIWKGLLVQRGEGNVIMKHVDENVSFKVE